MKRFLTWLWHSAIAFAGHAFAALVILAVLTALKALRDNNDFEYYWENWRELISPAIVTVLLMSVVALFLVVVRQKSTLSSFGVRLFSRHDTADTKKRDWSLVCNDIKAASDNKLTLWVLGATGKETFSSATSPLFDTLKHFEGDIKILLIRPKSFAFKTRCDGLKVSDDSYLEEILDSIDYCKEIYKRRGKAIELKLYEHLPIWKMLMTPSRLWVQYYKANQHVDNTPMYCFDFKGEGTTLFDGFRSVFQKRWNHDDSPSVDLGAFVRSSWEKHC